MKARKSEEGVARAALQAAVQKRRGAEVALQQAEAALERGRSVLSAAYAEQDSAEEAAARLKAEALTARVKAVASGHALVIERPRDLVGEAEQKVAAAREVVDQLKAAVAGAERDLSGAKRAVRDQIGMLLATAAAAEMEAIGRLQAEVEGRRARLSRTHSWLDWRSDAARVVGGFLGRNLTDLERCANQKSHPLAIAFDEAVARLEADPDAPLPF